jgi:SAM-dependent methyltransferase
MAVYSQIHMAPCPVCGAVTGEALKPPHPTRSVTSGGIVLSTPLQKIQCLDCGVLRQRPHEQELKNAFYRDQYASYHQRVGTSQSELVRYDDIAKWILAELRPFRPQSVLDVGCAGGFLLDALRKNHPGAAYEGIDPSVQNSELARARGFIVSTGFVPGTNPPRNRYDLVLASHVISHIVDPILFIAAMANMMNEGGRLVIYAHDGSEPGADSLFADIEFSFSREHVGALGAKVGLELLTGSQTSRPAGQADKHVLVFQRNASASAPLSLDAERRTKLLTGRSDYFAAWRELAARLAKHVENAHSPVFNFGASFWSILLAAYCPEYWERVDACIVDAGTGMFFGKSILASSSIARKPAPLIVLGVNPASQSFIAQRLRDFGEVVIWSDMIHQ